MGCEFVGNKEVPFAACGAEHRKHRGTRRVRREAFGSDERYWGTRVTSEGIDENSGQ